MSPLKQKQSKYDLANSLGKIPKILRAVEAAIREGYSCVIVVDDAEAARTKIREIHKFLAENDDYKIKKTRNNIFWFTRGRIEVIYPGGQVSDAARKADFVQVI